LSDDYKTRRSSEEVSQRPDLSETAATEAAVTVHLEDRFQRRNAVLYVSKWCLVYLAAPVLYIGFVQAGLCKRLGASDFVANLPSSAYLLLAAFPMIMAWAVPQVRYLKLVMTIGFTITALTGAAMRAAYSAEPVAREDAQEAARAAQTAIRDMRRNTALVRRLTGVYRPGV